MEISLQDMFFKSRHKKVQDFFPKKELISDGQAKGKKNLVSKVLSTLKDLRLYKKKEPSFSSIL
jgi:hypothetical protein